jgi:aryl-alcohol dehydrogenase (NADP+)
MDNVEFADPGDGTALNGPVLRGMLAYWRALAGSREFPEPRDLDPAAIHWALGRLTLIDVTGEGARARFRYALCGGRLVAHFGNDLTGKWLDENPNPDVRARFGGLRRDLAPPRAGDQPPRPRQRPALDALSGADLADGRVRRSDRALDRGHRFRFAEPAGRRTHRMTVHRALGRSGLKVSPLCLGTMMFGDRTDEAAAARILASARAAGVNFLDTADAYAGGESERIVGRLIAPARARWVVATKIANPAPGDDPNARGTSRRWLIAGCEASLKRLGTDHIDLYYLHRDDPTTPMEETIATLGDLIRAGKIRYVGLSNFRAWRMASFVALCKAMGVPAPIACQPWYNLFDRQAETEILPACAELGLGVVPYSPLARGVLTAKYIPGGNLDPETRAGRGDKRIHQSSFRPEALVLAQNLAAFARERGTDAGALAVGWVLANPYVTSVLAGPRTLAQWESYVSAAARPFDPAEETHLSALVPPGHPATLGFTDPQYPILGRPTA